MIKPGPGRRFGLKRNPLLPSAPTHRAAVIGAGPAGLMAAETLARGGASVTVYERMPSPARKLLLAGRGGLNLTHTEAIESFLTRYGSAAPHLRAAIEALPPQSLRAWCEELGVPTFAGSSGRVFPKSMKTSPLLRAWLRRLGSQGIEIRTSHRWLGWDDAGALRFETREGEVTVTADVVVLALGGASWPHLGSDGSWVEPLTAEGVETAPLAPSNAGFLVSWSEIFRDKFQGEPLKRIALSFGRENVRGEAMITKTGIEGGAIYALSGPLREAIRTDGEAVLHIDLRPDMPHTALEQRLAKPRGKQSLATFLRKTVQLSAVDIGLLQEAAHAAGTPLTTYTPETLAALIKALPVSLKGMAPIARAISSAGGVAFGSIDDQFMLTARPGVFVAGEMLDWEAPTGGYLLQACFATGAAAGRGALAWLENTKAA
jgi:uncharacterized flavoprotein (TIGR03862 family)